MIKELKKIKVYLNSTHVGTLALTPDNLAALNMRPII